MNMSDIKVRATKLLRAAKDFADDCQSLKDDLEDEQGKSEKAHEDWSEESGEPEPELIDNEQDIEQLQETLLDIETIIAGIDDIEMRL